MSSSFLSYSKDIYGYLQTLEIAQLRKLYAARPQGPYVCRAILQRLTECDQQMVLRLAVCGGSFPLSKLTDWWQRNKHQVMGTLRVMVRWGIVESNILSAVAAAAAAAAAASSGASAAAAAAAAASDKATSTATVSLTAEYLAGIRESLVSTQSSSPWTTVPPHVLEAAKRLAGAAGSNSSFHRPPSLEDLEVFTRRRWDSVLHFLVGTNDASVDDPPPAVVHFLEKTGLLQEDPDFVKPAGSSSSGRYSDSSLASVKAPLVITSKGYEFMLQDVRIQVWQFVLQYLKSLESKSQGGDALRSEAILFLICLSFCRVGIPYTASSLSRDARTLMRDFSQFGLLYVTKMPVPPAAGGGGGGDKAAAAGAGANTPPTQITIFYPTRVAVNLISGGSSDLVISAATTPVVPEVRMTDAQGNSNNDNNNDDDDEDDEEKEKRNSRELAKCAASTSSTRALEMALEAPNPTKSSHLAIIVQTNFQLCAYTASELHVSMLGLFCDLPTCRRLPNVIFFKITRDSVKAAFRLGITATQMLRFLRLNAHPKLRTGDQPLVPSNVEDQIWLWERERTRVKFQQVYSLQCHSVAEYQAAMRYCHEIRALGWSADAKNQILVKYDKAEAVLSYVRKYRSGK